MEARQQFSASEQHRFEYDLLVRSYNEYMHVAAKGITIYLVVVGACLTLPNSLNLGSNDRNLVFREMCRVLATVVSLGALVLYTAASFGFWGMHKRARELSALLNLSNPTTWILPFGIWVCCASAAILLILIVRYT
jgi:uncharacterized iron-regulated membrane protein